MYQKFKQLDQSNAPVPDILNSGFVLSQECSETYRIHVQQSSVKRASRFRDILVNNRQRTKIQIKGFHVTKGEFVDSLCSRGEVCQNLMGLCCVAIMCDWETRSKSILDQATIVELMKDGSVCDHMLLACRFTKLRIEDVELIYLPILSGKHWILAVVDIVKEITEFYDSLLAVTHGAHPHKEL